MAPHSSTLAWKIPWMEEPGRLQSMGSLRVGYDWATSLSLSTFMIGGGNGNPLQCSCLKNPRDGGAWWAAVYGVAQSRTRLKRLSSSSSSSMEFLVKRTTATLRLSGKESAVQELQDTQVQSLGWEDPLEKEMETHSSILAWRIPMDRGVWQATVHRVTKNRAWLRQLGSTHVPLIVLISIILFYPNDKDLLYWLSVLYIVVCIC